jgi:hypothetical protein
MVCREWFDVARAAPSNVQVRGAVRIGCSGGLDTELRDKMGELHELLFGSV